MGFNSKPAVLLYWEAIFYWMSFSKRPVLYCELHLYSGLHRQHGNSLYVKHIVRESTGITTSGDNALNMLWSDPSRVRWGAARI